MNTFFLNLLSVFAFGVYTHLEASELVITNTSKAIPNLEALNSAFNKALSFYEKELGTVVPSIYISIQDNDCFRTGFNPEQNKVVFCNNTNTINYGLNSIDVINHELFHAFLFNQRPFLYKKGINEEIHEGLADYFSYKLNSDNYFGENFYIDKDSIRTYKTSLRLGLVQGIHAKGNVIASQLILSQSTFKDSLTLFDQNAKNVDEVEEFIIGRPVSKLNRYRLDPDELLEVSFTFQKSSNVSYVKWESDSGVEINVLSESSASFKLSKGVNRTSLDAVFYSSDGVILGYRHYYIGSIIK